MKQLKLKAEGREKSDWNSENQPCQNQQTISYVESYNNYLHDMKIVQQYAYATAKL